MNNPNQTYSLSHAAPNPRCALAERRRRAHRHGPLEGSRRDARLLTTQKMKSKHDRRNSSPPLPLSPISKYSCHHCQLRNATPFPHSRLASPPLATMDHSTTTIAATATNTITADPNGVFIGAGATNHTPDDVLLRDLRLALKKNDFPAADAILIARPDLKKHFYRTQIRDAVANNNIDMVKFLRSHNFPWDERVCATAAQHGHLHILQWAHENGCPWDEKVCANAAYKGHLHVLQWAHDKGCPLSRTLCAAAADGGQLNTLQWAHEHGCPWDTWTCFTAAIGGHLEVLQWAREHGCPWEKENILRHNLTPEIREWVCTQPA